MTRGNGTKGTNRRKKPGLALALILLLVLIIALAYFFLAGQNSEEKKQYEAQIKQETQDFTDGLVSELEKIDTSDEGLAEESGTEPSSEAPPEIVTEAEKKVVSEELAKLEDERKQQVLKTLTAAYSQALQAQKQEALNMVEALIAQGKADWAALSAKGENTSANKGLLASEYLAKAGVLEEQMDASFHALLAKMEEQLTAEGIDSTALIAQYQAEYKKIKEENRSAMMSKAMAALKK